jgi:hypothetical protein
MHWLQCLLKSGLSRSTVRIYNSGRFSIFDRRLELARMHELQRKQLVRTLFVLLCVLPAVVICVFSVWMHTSAYRDRLSAVVERTTGTTVRIERITHPQPFVTRIYGLEVTDPETSNLLMESGRLDIVRTNLGYEIDGDMILHADLDEAWRIINHRLLTHQWDDSVERITLRCDQLQWKNQVASQSFRQVKCELKTSRSESNAEVLPQKQKLGSIADHVVSATNESNMHVGFRSGAANASKESDHGELAVFRFTSAGRSRTVVSLRTKGQAIQPAVLCPEWFPFVGESRLDLDLHAVHDSKAWRGEATNVHWNGLDGCRLMNEQFAPLRLLGDFSVRNASVIFQNSFLRTIEGDFECQSGRISRQMIHRLVTQGFRLSAEPQTGIVDFRRLHARFHLSGDGSRIDGKCATTSGTKEAAVIDADTFQLYSPERTLMIDDLVSTLVSPNRSRSSGTIENLRRLLPLDPIRVAERQ